MIFFYICRIIYNIYPMNIKKVIKDKGWTLDALAKEMTNKSGQKGIAQASVSQIINGNPTLDKLQEIASIIGVSVSELVSDNPTDLASNICPHCGQPIVVKTTIEKG